MSNKNGQNIVVTGASWGIGRAIAIHLARKGNSIIATARRESMLKETLALVNSDSQHSYAFAADLGDHTQILKLAQFVEDKWGRLDALVNVAFGSLETPLEETPDSDLTNFMNVSVTGTLLLTKHMLPLFQDGNGHIINIIADWGLPMHNIMTEAMTPYITAKHALSGFTHTLRRELGLSDKPRLKVTGIYPGATAAIDFETLTSLSIDDPVGLSGDLISLKDIAESVSFVLGQEHSTVTHLVIAPPNNLYNGLNE